MLQPMSRLALPVPVFKNEKEKKGYKNEWAGTGSCLNFFLVRH